MNCPWPPPARARVTVFGKAPAGIEIVFVPLATTLVAVFEELTAP